MRRKKQALSNDECIEILKKGTSGVLAVSGDDDYPYAVPLSYVYCEGKIYFHCAKKGHKLDAIARSSKVSFCVINKDSVVPEEYTTYFRSVIAFGRARVLERESERQRAMEVLAAKYSPEHVSGRKAEIQQGIKNTCLVEIEIDHMSGKEAIELVKARAADGQ